MARAKYHLILLSVSIVIGLVWVFALNALGLTSDVAVVVFMLVGIVPAICITRLITGQWKG